MKFSALFLALAVSATDAFVAPKPSSTTTIMQGTPFNGGTAGSSNLPGQYDRINVNSPYGSSRKDAPAPTGGNRRAPINEYTSDTQIDGVRGGPVNGGTNGSSLLPDRYGTVSIDNPWGNKNPQAPMDYYSPQSATQVIPGKNKGLLPATSPIDETGAAKGMTGGAEGSSRIVDRGVVGIDAPWGERR